MLKSIFIYRQQSINCHLKNPEPEVAIFIPVFNEEPKIVEATLAEVSLINYKNYEIFLLDDSTDDATRKALKNVRIKNDINYVHRGNRRGFKAGAINDVIKNIEKNTKYLLILDADHRPIPTILNEMVLLLEEYNTIAFIQTPQYFSSKTKNRLACAYSFEEHLFHKHVCRGKNVNNATFMGGTNLIVRLSYLKKIGGFDETNITEDVATSFIFHSHGYNTVYLDKVYAEGLSPSSLAAYHTQRMRYAYGGIQNFKNVLKMLFTCPHSLRIGQWWEYLLSGSWYFLIWTQLLLMIYPIVIILFGIQPCASIFLFVFITCISMTGCQIFTSMRERGYRITRPINGTRIVL